MTMELESTIREICEKYSHDKTRMMDIVHDVQEKFGYVNSQAMELIAKEVGTHQVEVKSVVTFYAFLSMKPKGDIVIRLCDDIIDRMKGASDVAAAMAAELGIAFGETTADKRFTLEYAPSIGLSDQAPAALINNVPVTNLTPDSARDMIQALKGGASVQDLVKEFGDGNNASDAVRSMVKNNIRLTGDVIFAPITVGDALRKTIAMSPGDVIRGLKASGLRGRGGAGFPTGLKWEFTSGAAGDEKYVICNADEGEPGTFKDRVLLTEKAEMLFEGMTISGYAIGAEHGILYLRGEYAYLAKYLENVLSDLRGKNLLGQNILGKDGFHFDIRIQLGAGAYICGEETALISSCEGLRGDPKTRPPFPAQKGHLGKPTTVNNVETFCCVSRVMEKGADWFAAIGSDKSSGTKLLSVSGDCDKPGVYEVPFGISVRELLDRVGAVDTAAVQIGGPSGQLISPAMFDKTICYNDLATGGSVMVFNSSRDLLSVVDYFMDFFVEESCGYCTPCRVGNVLLKKRLDKIIAGKGEPSDLPYLKELGESVKFSSRCGLGQTSPNPILTSMKNFPELYNAKLTESQDGLQPGFDLAMAVNDAETITGRESEYK